MVKVLHVKLTPENSMDPTRLERQTSMQEADAGPDNCLHLPVDAPACGSRAIL